MKILAMAALLMVSPGVIADTWVNFGGVSHHFSDRKINNKNYGLGIETTIGGLLVGAGMYQNSIGNASRYIVAEKCMVDIGPACFGAMAGFVDGYKYNSGGWIPMVAPTITFDVGRLGARIVYVQAVDDRIAAVISLQFRVKIDHKVDMK